MSFLIHNSGTTLSIVMKVFCGNGVSTKSTFVPRVFSNARLMRKSSNSVIVGSLKSINKSMSLFCVGLPFAYEPNKSTFLIL